MNQDSRRGRGSMKLLGSLRGEGELSVGADRAPVRYQLDLFEARNGRVGSGTLDGDLAGLGEASAMTLRLADGFAVEVKLVAVDEDGGLFETRGDLPEG